MYEIVDSDDVFCLFEVIFVFVLKCDEVFDSVCIGSGVMFYVRIKYDMCMG